MGNLCPGFKLTHVLYWCVHVYHYSFMLHEHSFHKCMQLKNDLYLCVHAVYLHILHLNHNFDNSISLFSLKLEYAFVSGSNVFSLTSESKSLSKFCSCSTGILFRLIF